MTIAKTGGKLKAEPASAPPNFHYATKRAALEILSRTQTNVLAADVRIDLHRIAISVAPPDVADLHMLRSANDVLGSAIA
jgi:hypothetical protein